MVISWMYTGIIGIAFVFSVISGKTAEVAAATASGAQAGVTVAISMAGSLCLWSGVGKLMEKAGISEALSRLLKPLTTRIFPSTKQDSILAGHLCANICANILGLGNAATPMGIQAARRLARSKSANDELCRLIVLNTASIQLIPATVAALRSSLGCNTPFDILPAVWITSLCSAGMGLTAAFIFGKLWHHD